LGTSLVRYLNWIPIVVAAFSALPARSDIDRHRSDPLSVFRLQATLGVVGMLAATAAVATAVSSVQHAPGNAGHVMLGHLRFTYPTLNLAAALLLVLAALGVAVLSIALRSGLRQHRAYRSFLRRVDILGSLQGHHAATVIEGSTPQAFCAGFLRPAVYVSRRTVELLSEDELHAVLAHEHHHLRVRDPLRLAIARILGQALFFLPVLRPLGDRYGELAEITADHAAVGASCGREGPLASALLAFEGGGPEHAAGISNERVDSLLGRPTAWRMPSTPMAISLLGLTSLSVLLWRAGEVASAHASLNLPAFSARPCLALLSVMPMLAVARIVARRRSTGQAAARVRPLLARS
jgi:Zn-dependent protease with chaperone function